MADPTTWVQVTDYDNDGTTITFNGTRDPEEEPVPVMIPVSAVQYVEGPADGVLTVNWRGEEEFQEEGNPPE